MDSLSEQIFNMANDVNNAVLASIKPYREKIEELEKRIRELNNSVSQMDELLDKINELDTELYQTAYNQTMKNRPVLVEEKQE